MVKAVIPFIELMVLALAVIVAEPGLSLYLTR
jgi:hypothetical protein